MLAALDHCLRTPPTAQNVDTVAQWWPQWRRLTADFQAPAEIAIRGGFAADRVGWAFAGGYQAALHALVPDLPRDALAAFCATEENGNRPRDIKTTLTPQADGTIAVSGAKRWTTLGPDSTLLLVVTALAGNDGRPQLKVVRVPASAPGVELQLMPETGFVPEVPHARIRLDDVLLPAAAVLPGDGYDAYVKPFRSCEDIYVSLGVLAYLLREARARAWPAFAEKLAAAIVALSAIGDGDITSAGSHLALAGALHWTHALYQEADALWAACGSDPAAARWQRDRALFALAGTARGLRASKAWEALAAA